MSFSSINDSPGVIGSGLAFRVNEKRVVIAETETAEEHLVQC